MHTRTDIAGIRQDLTHSDIEVVGACVNRLVGKVREDRLPKITVERLIGPLVEALISFGAASSSECMNISVCIAEILRIAPDKAISVLSAEALGNNPTRRAEAIAALHEFAGIYHQSGGVLGGANTFTDDHIREIKKVAERLIHDTEPSVALSVSEILKTKIGVHAPQAPDDEVIARAFR